MMKSYVLKDYKFMDFKTLKKSVVVVDKEEKEYRCVGNFKEIPIGTPLLMDLKPMAKEGNSIINMALDPNNKEAWEKVLTELNLEKLLRKKDIIQALKGEVFRLRGTDVFYPVSNLVNLAIEQDILKFAPTLTRKQLEPLMKYISLCGIRAFRGNIFNVLKSAKDVSLAEGYKIAVASSEGKPVVETLCFHDYLVDKTISDVSSTGSTWITLKGLKAQVTKNLHFAIDKDIYPNSEMVDYCINHNPRLEFDGERIFIKDLHFKEMNLFFMLQGYFNEELFSDDEIAKMKEDNKFFNEGQKNAYDLLKTTGLKILTGSAGTGKTTVLKELIAQYEKKFENCNIVLSAPTGKASQRMSEATGRTAYTLYQLMIKVHNAEIKDEKFDCDFLIIDESSMMDIEVAYEIFRKLPRNTLVFLVGDVNQLPSIGAGEILYDLIDSGKFPSVMLKEICRQSGESKIISNSYKVINKDSSFDYDNSFRLIQLNYSNDNLARQKEREKIVKNYVNNVKDGLLGTQILCSTNNKWLGCFILNKEIQDLLIERGIISKTPYVPYGNVTFHLGDKVIFNSNNYELDYYNGDIGTISYINLAEKKIVVSCIRKTIEIATDMLEDLSLAYAITIHKSQGSEFKNVYVVLSSESRGMNTNNLLYTAITRAKENVAIFVDSPELLEKACNRVEAGNRRTNIKLENNK